MVLAWKYCERSLICGLLICLSIIDLSAKALDEPIPVEPSSADTTELKNLYDSVLRNMDTPSEWRYLDSLENEAAKEKNTRYQGIAYRNKVRYYYNKTNFDSAVYYANRAIPFFKKNNQREFLTDVESMIVNLHTWRNEYEFALIKANEMYDESERMGDKLGMVAACENIGFALANSYRERDALNWYRKSLSLLESMEAQEVYEMQMEVLIVDCFMMLNEVDSMKAHLDNLRVLLDGFDENSGRHQYNRTRIQEYWVWLYAQLAEASIREGSFEKAREYLDEAGRYVARGVEDMSMEVYYWASSNYYQAIGDYAKALDMEKKSSQYSMAYKDDSSEQYYRFATIYENLGDFKQASSYYRNGLALSDSVNNRLFSTQISQFNSIYEVDELTEEGEFRRMEVGLLSIIFGSILVFALLLGVFVFIFLRYKRRLSEATRKAKEEDLRTTIFLDNVSREIRGALDEIAGLSRSLMDETGADGKKQYSELVRSKNETLQRVIFNILDVSKIESGRMVFDYMSIYLPDMMRGVKSWASQFMSSSRSFNLLSEPKIYLKSDLSRLRQILENLLCYFISHSSRGDITMDYREEGKWVVFDIFCEELNLADEEREMLFDRQVQAGKRLEDMGLELVICKDLIMKMGGVLTVSDSKRKGMGFRFTLPIGKD